MADAVIQGVFSDFKLVKTRNVLQLIFEIPAERGQEALETLGIPLPGSELPVAIARLVASPAPRESVPLPSNPREIKDPTRSQRGKELYASKDDMAKAASRAAMLCKDPQFQDWLRAKDGMPPFMPQVSAETREHYAARVLKGDLGISSRSLIGSSERVYNEYLGLEAEYTYRDTVR